MRVHRTRRYGGVEIPDVLEQRIATDDAALPAEQETGQIELALRQLDIPAVDADAPALPSTR